METNLENTCELLNNYKFSETERRILEVALDPTYTAKSLKDKCSAANVAKNTWYKAMSNPDFIKILNKLSLDMLKGKINDVVNATYKYAISGLKNSQDRKMLLTMAGLYKDKTELSTDKDGLTINNNVDLTNLSVEEIKDLLNKE